MIAAVLTPLIWAAGFYTAALIVHELWASADKIAAALNFEPIPGSARHGR